MAEPPPDQSPGPAAADSVGSTKALNLSSVPAEAVTPGAGPQYAKKKKPLHAVEIRQGVPLDLQEIVAALEKLDGLLSSRHAVRGAAVLRLFCSERLTTNILFPFDRTIIRMATLIPPRC